MPFLRYRLRSVGLGRLEKVWQEMRLMGLWGPFHTGSWEFYPKNIDRQMMGFQQGRCIARLTVCKWGSLGGSVG